MIILLNPLGITEEDSKTMNFDNFNKRHIRLLKLDDQKKLTTKDILTYIEDAKRAGRVIEEPNERHYLRTYLMFWGARIYDELKWFPGTSLEPLIKK